MSAVLALENVTYAYSNGGKKLSILVNASTAFEKGVFYTIVGPSGSGKTTTLALAGALDVPQKGQVLYNGTDIRKIGLTKHRRNNVTLIFQSYNLINYMTALENVMMAMEISGSYKGNQKSDALRLLNELGISNDEAKRNVLKLSGGQQQRVAIARSLATDSEVILADEPTGNLDPTTASEIIKIFQDLAHKHNKCVIVVSHSHDVADASDKAYQIKKGVLNEVPLRRQT